MTNYGSFILFCYVSILCGCHGNFANIKRECVPISRMPSVKPDYAGITIPPNIAPINFYLQDSCIACVAEITSKNGSPITVWGKNGVFRIDAALWKRLLLANRGMPLRITVYAKNGQGAWHRFTTIENTIAADTIDRYCTYRLLNFQYSYWRDLSECQRDLTSFDENVLVNTKNYTNNYTQNSSKNGTQNDAFKCINCHIPMNNDPSRFVFQLRSAAYGSETLIADGDSITKLSSRLGHAAWHPSGKYIAFAIYKVQQYFHSVGRQFIDVYDNNSYIVIYDVAAKKIISVPQLNQEGMLETWPAWSADGRYLYFCSAPVLWSDYNNEPPDNFNKTRYSLMRISYDPVQNSWGDVDTMLSTNETGLSISLPRVSPDNRFCLFCMQDYGPYSYIRVSSDLYLMDLSTRQYYKLPVNSEYNESWHSWSTNGRWILFASRRGGGILTRLYISHIDSAGNASKPFVVPQKDPAFYDTFTKCYNVAELATAPVHFSERQLFKAIMSKQSIKVPIPPKTGLTSTDSVSGNSWSSVYSRE